jgi:hypothetical protein
MSDGMSAILVVTDGDMLEPRNNVNMSSSTVE